MRFKRQNENAATLTFSAAETQIMRELCTELRELLASPDYTKRAMQKLFPRLSDDPKTDAELRQLLQDEHRRQKLQRADELADLLAGLPPKGGGISLTNQQLEHLLTVLNDLRFIYADALGIEHDSWRPARNLKPADPRARQTAIYLHLSAVQEFLIERAFG